MARFLELRTQWSVATAGALVLLLMMVIATGCDEGSDPIVPPDDTTENVIGPPYGCVAWFDGDRRVVTLSEGEDTLRYVLNTGEPGGLSEVGYTVLWNPSNTVQSFMVYDAAMQSIVVIGSDGDQETIGQNVLEGYYGFSPSGSRLFFVSMEADTTRVWRHALAPVNETVLVAEYVVPERVRHMPSIISVGSVAVNIWNSDVPSLSRIDYWNVGEDEPYNVESLNTSIFQVSPEGGSEAYVQTGASTLEIVVDGTTYDLSEYGLDLASFIWSPMQDAEDPARIAAYVTDGFMDPSKLVYIDLDAGTVNEIAPQGVEWFAGWEETDSYAWTWPDWSPDGSKLVGLARAANGTYQVVTTDMEGNATVLASGQPLPCRPTWDPNCDSD